MNLSSQQNNDPNFVNLSGQWNNDPNFRLQNLAKQLNIDTNLSFQQLRGSQFNNDPNFQQLSSQFNNDPNYAQNLGWSMFDGDKVSVIGAQQLSSQFNNDPNYRLQNLGGQFNNDPNFQNLNILCSLFDTDCKTKMVNVAPDGKKQVLG